MSVSVSLVGPACTELPIVVFGNNSGGKARLDTPLVVAAWLKVIDNVVELIAATVVPARMPVPVTVSPTTRSAVLGSPVTEVLPCSTPINTISLSRNVRFSAGSTVAAWLKVIAVFELIAVMIVPLGSPFP